MIRGKNNYTYATKKEKETNAKLADVKKERALLGCKHTDTKILGCRQKKIIFFLDLALDFLHRSFFYMSLIMVEGFAFTSGFRCLFPC